MFTLTEETPIVKAEYAEWVEAQREDIVDRVLIARNCAYVENDLQASFVEAMSFHARECKARYRTAWNMDLWLGQETAFGMKWGKR